MGNARLIPIVIIGLAALIVLVGVLNLFFGDAPDYAGLVPAPDTVLWEEGDETTLWLNTNLEAVEVRIAAVALGIGSFKRALPETNQALDLGRGEGCLTWGVTSLEVLNIIDAQSGTRKRLTIQGGIEPATASDARDVFIRVYPEGADLRDIVHSEGYDAADISDRNVDASGRLFKFPIAAANNGRLLLSSPDAFGFYAINFDLSPTEGIWVVEASHDPRFPATSRIATMGNVADLKWEPAMSVAEDIIMPYNLGLGIIACSEADDVLVTLHNAEGVEINRYLVDIHADEVATPPVAQPGTVTPLDVRVCVDSSDARANYLDGWELAGGALAPARFGYSGSSNTIAKVTLADTVESNAFIYFFVAELKSDGNVQLWITKAGASDTSGLDSDRIYPISLTATLNADGNNLEKELAVGVWLDTSKLSPSDNGQCT